MDMIDLRLKILSWDEKPYREFDGGGKFSRAEVSLGTDDLSATFDALLAYQPDGTSTYVTLMRIAGTLDGRHGGFVLRGHGTFDGTTARVEAVIVEGSGTGELAGITGTAHSSSTHADYPYMPLVLEYAVP